MNVQQVFTPGLAHCSYLVTGKRACVVVDPRRDVEVYLEAARRRDVEITHILSTHLHADFVSGHLDLARATGAEIYAPRAAGCVFSHKGVSEGDRFEVENMEFTVLETPGHTPEHVCCYVIDRSRGTEPVGVFTGDTLFVGDVGRPDLFPGKAERLGSDLFDSLHQKLLELPDFCRVFPAHGAGSLCGKPLSAGRTTTVGYERKFNPALRITDREEFIETLSRELPPAPDHFARVSAVNGGGPALVKNLPDPEPLDPEDFRARSREKDALVLDVRSYDAFGGQHVPGALHVDLAGNFPIFAGWLIPAEAEILLVGENAEQLQSALTGLRRVGLDRTPAFLAGGMTAWARAGFETAHAGQLSIAEAQRMMEGERQVTVLDVRDPSEFRGYHIKGAVNVPLPDLRQRWDEFPPADPLLLVAGTGRRSSTAASILKQNGVWHVFNAAGGMDGFHAAGSAPEAVVSTLPHGPRLL
jgi:glyoxylase-like metal-dependent hydrolase (beta-lactamase superfamily II)/rhodanese-related sulfurtransferase